jgi:CelD/BcsL family acetyltransferase involved in cellulose biosynthesis
MQCETIDPRSDPEWNAFIRRVDSSIFHTPMWMNVISATYGISFSAAVVVDDTGKYIAGLPYAVVDDARSRRAVLLPFSDFCDPLVDSMAEWTLLADQLISLGIPVSIRCIKSDLPMADDRFALVGKAMWHGVDVSGEPAAIRRGIHRSAKNKINKARKAGVEVRTGGAIADVRSFFDLHVRVRKYRHGLLAQPIRFFETLWRHLIETGEGTLLLADLGGEPIGAIFLLQWQDTLYYKFSAMSRKHMPLGANDLLLWHAILEAKERDLELLDLGPSDIDQPGLVDYKRKFATREAEILRLTHTPPGLDLRRTAELDQVLGAVTELLTRAETPDAVTEEAGDVLYQYFA